MTNAALTLMGPIALLSVNMKQFHKGAQVNMSNDDHAQVMCRFDSGAMGHMLILVVLRQAVKWVTRMKYMEQGSVRFDERSEFNMALPIRRARSRKRFRQILTGPTHPDYRSFCQGPGHGTGYQRSNN